MPLIFPYKFVLKTIKKTAILTFFSLINSAVVRTIIFPSTVGPIKAQMNRKTTLNIKPLSFKLFIETIKVQI